MKQFNFIIIFAFFFKAVKSQGTTGTAVYDPRPSIYEFFINTIIPLVIVTVFFVGIHDKIAKYLIKLLDDLLFFGLFILLPIIYYLNVIKKPLEEGINLMSVGALSLGVIVGITFTFFWTLKKHSLAKKFIIGIVYFLVMTIMTLCFTILLRGENAEKCYNVYNKDLCKLSGVFMLALTVTNVVIMIAILCIGCSRIDSILRRMFWVILSVFIAEIIILGVVCSWFLSDNLYQTKGVLAYVTFCVSRLIDTSVHKDKRTNSVIENIFELVGAKKNKNEPASGDIPLGDMA